MTVTQGPKYRRIAATLRGRIVTGEIPAGGQLPTEKALSQSWQAAIETVRNALKQLRDEGLVEARPPFGWYAVQYERRSYYPQRDGRTPDQLHTTEPFVTQTTDEGRSPAQEIDVVIAVPPETVRKKLQLDTDGIAVLRKRVRYINNQPTEINDSYFIMSMVANTAIVSPGDIPQGTSYALAQQGIYQDTAREEFKSRMPSDEERQRLDIGTVPVIEFIQTTYTEANDPVRCTVNILPGTRHCIIYERKWAQ